MKARVLVLVLLLAGCGHTASDLAALQPGVDVARAALNGGSPQTALEIAGKVLVQDPGNEAAFVVQGDALTELGRLDDARVSYQNALKSNPQSVDADIGLGRLDLESNPAQAELRFIQALRHEPRNIRALNDLGVARDLQGHHAKAQVAYSEALGINPDDNAAEVNLALSIAMSGDADRAVQMLRPLATAPGASLKLRHDLAAALTMAGHRDEAARILSQDLSPAQVQEALNAYAAARTGGPVPLYPDASRPEEPAVLAPPARAAAVAAPPVTTAPVAAQPVSLTPGWEVQFAAVPTEDGAHLVWQQLQTQMPALLGGRQPDFIEVRDATATFWRVRTDGFSDAAQADAFCAKVKAAGRPCIISR